MSIQKDNGQPQDSQKEHWHRRLLEGRVGLFAIVTTVVISVGGIVEIVPMFTVKAGPPPLEGVTPYSPLELAGRDIYVREGCYLCHSQMIRPMRAELQRYGEWTRAGELAYDRPFQLGSRRIGPDLQRVGGKYPDAWHYEHMRDPRSTSPGSIMPPYPWLLTRRLDAKDVARSVKAMQRLGVPYHGVTPEGVARSIAGQGAGIVASLAAMNIQTEPDREIIAMIAYLQRLGQDGTAAMERRQRMEAAARAASDPTAAAASGAAAAAGSAAASGSAAADGAAAAGAPAPADPHAAFRGQPPPRPATARVPNGPGSR
jgi:cytochrome c oxidase cbb3-type subunit I/II